jgi:hypothetical protein
VAKVQDGICHRVCRWPSDWPRFGHDTRHSYVNNNHRAWYDHDNNHRAWYDHDNNHRAWYDHDNDYRSWYDHDHRAWYDHDNNIANVDDHYDPDGAHSRVATNWECRHRRASAFRRSRFASSTERGNREPDEDDDGLGCTTSDAGGDEPAWSVPHGE